MSGREAPESVPPLTAMPPTVAESRQLVQVFPADAAWVLVKGYHDSGTIDGVFGPYTQEQADWLLSELLDCSSYNWTKAELRKGPET